VEQAERFKHQASSLELERDTLARKADSATQMAAQAAGATLALSLQHQQLVEQYAKLEGHAKDLLKQRNELAEKVGGAASPSDLTYHA
jgi:putative cell wall-binding protein